MFSGFMHFEHYAVVVTASGAATDLIQMSPVQILPLPPTYLVPLGNCLLLTSVSSLQYGDKKSESGHTQGNS